MSIFQSELTSTIVDYSLAKKALTTALQTVIDAEPDITNYDTIVGDGDHTPWFVLIYTLHSGGQNSTIRKRSSAQPHDSSRDAAR